MNSYNQRALSTLLPTSDKWEFGSHLYGLEPLALPPTWLPRVPLARRPSLVTPSPQTAATLIPTKASEVDRLFWFRWITGHQTTFILWQLLAAVINEAAQPEAETTVLAREARHLVRGYSLMLLYTSSPPQNLYERIIREPMARQHPNLSGSWACDYQPVRPLMRGKIRVGDEAEASALAAECALNEVIHEGIAARVVPSGISLLQSPNDRKSSRPLRHETLLWLYDGIFLTSRLSITYVTLVQQLARRLQAILLDIAANGLYPTCAPSTAEEPPQLLSDEVKALKAAFHDNLHALIACADVSGSRKGHVPVVSTAEDHLSPETYCAETFNGAVASAALSAAWETGLLDELATERRVVADEWAKAQDAHPEVVRALLVALASRRIVRLDENRAVATCDIGFDSAYDTRGFFYWLTRGCGELFTTLGTKVAYKDRQGDYVRRDSKAISVACRSIAQSFFDPPFRELLEGISFSAVADLGCGSGHRLIMLAALRPEMRAIGIDIAEGAIKIAEEAVVEAGFSRRVSLLQEDVLGLTPRPEFDDVELVTCFLMGHDFWPRNACVRTLRELRVTFPNIKHLILGDTCRSTGIKESRFPMFTLGFETVHTIMDQYLPTLDEWDGVLRESGWEVADRRLIDLPAFSFVYRLTPA